VYGCAAGNRKQLQLGRGTEIAFREFRSEIALYENDRPISPDIQKAYEFIRNGKLIREIRDRLL